MSNKLKASRKPARPADPVAVAARPSSPKSDAARPFDPAVWARAAALAGRYGIVLWPEAGEFYARGLEVPDAMSDGPTPDECVRNVREALALHTAAMIERGEAPPEPLAGAEKRAARTVQVNVRMTEAERAAVEAAARREGFRGVSDFVRAAAVNRAAGAAAVG